MVYVIGQFKATTEESVVISAIGGFMPGVLTYHVGTTLDYQIVLKDGYAPTVKTLQTARSKLLIQK